MIACCLIVISLILPPIIIGQNYIPDNSNDSNIIWDANFTPTFKYYPVNSLLPAGSVKGSTRPVWITPDIRKRLNLDVYPKNVPFALVQFAAELDNRPYMGMFLPTNDSIRGVWNFPWTFSNISYTLKPSSPGASYLSEAFSHVIYNHDSVFFITFGLYALNRWDGPTALNVDTWELELFQFIHQSPTSTPHIDNFSMSSNYGNYSFNARASIHM
jgi:hypothetical protein